MKKYSCRYTRVSLIVTICCHSLLFNIAHAEKQQGHDAHTHGEARLNLAQEDAVIHAEFESPAVNIIGFEHAPANDEQHQAIDQANSVLQDGESLLQFSEDAGCTLTDAQVDLASEHGDDEHSEYHVVYKFSCDNPEAVSSVRTMMFENFPGLESIRLNAATNRGQSAVTLTPDDTEARW